MAAAATLEIKGYGVLTTASKNSIDICIQFFANNLVSVKVFKTFKFEFNYSFLAL